MTEYYYREKRFVTSPARLHEELDIVLAGSPDYVQIQTLYVVRFDTDTEPDDSADDTEYLVTARYLLPEEEDE